MSKEDPQSSTHPEQGLASIFAKIEATLATQDAELQRQLYFIFGLGGFALGVITVALFLKLT